MTARTIQRPHSHSGDIRLDFRLFMPLSIGLVVGSLPSSRDTSSGRAVRLKFPAEPTTWLAAGEKVEVGLGVSVPVSEQCIVCMDVQYVQYLNWNEW